MVTLVPSAANIDAYSTPITPAPTTTIDVGIDLRSRMPSESSTRCSSNSTPFGPGRFGAGGDDDVFAADRGAFTAGTVFDEQGVLVDEPALARDQIDSVAHQLVAHHVGLFADDVLVRDSRSAGVILSLTR